MAAAPGGSGGGRVAWGGWRETPLRGKIQRFAGRSVSQLSRFLARLPCCLALPALPALCAVRFPFKPHTHRLLPPPPPRRTKHTRSEPARKTHTAPECDTVIKAFCRLSWYLYIFGIFFFPILQIDRGGRGEEKRKSPPKKKHPNPLSARSLK